MMAYTISDILDSQRLDQMADQHHDAYVSADSYPHIYIDNFLNSDILDQVLSEFPKPNDLEFYKYDNPLEKKLGMDQLSLLPPTIVSILLAFNSSVFLTFLEKLSGIDGLISDPYYRGGGIHQSTRGGKLDIHVDFNLHPKLKLERRLNVLLYLNKDWKPEYKGGFEIWTGHRSSSGDHVLDYCVETIEPLFNRFAMFNTSEKSYHGFPDPIQCPDYMTRKSIALYYYTVGRPDDELVDPHSTVFVKRPHDPDDHELDQMREKRNKGRLSTNVVNNQLK